MQLDDARFDTRAIHAGQEFDPTTGAVIPPVYLTSTYVQDGIGGLRNGYEYSRGGNPTRTALETQLAALEGGDPRPLVRVGPRGRGRAAARRARTRRPRRDRQRRVRRNAPAHPQGLRRVGHPPHHRRHERPRRRARGDRARRHQGALGRDAVEPADEDLGHRGARPSSATRPACSSSSTTRSRRPRCSSRSRSAPTSSCTRPRSTSAGTPTCVGGGLVFAAGRRGARRAGRVHPVRGGRRLEPVRRVPHVARHQDARHPDAAAQRERAGDRASGSRATPASSTCYYPGLESHPGHELAARQMSGFGGMISISLSGGAEAARRFAESTTLFQLAESLGGVESLVNYPSEMTHASVRGTEARGARVRRAPLGGHRGRRRPARRHRRGARAAVAAVGRVATKERIETTSQVSIRPLRGLLDRRRWENGGEACGSSPAPRR